MVHHIHMSPPLHHQPTAASSTSSLRSTLFDLTLPDTVTIEVNSSAITGRIIPGEVMVGRCCHEVTIVCNLGVFQLGCYGSTNNLIIRFVYLITIATWL